VADSAESAQPPLPPLLVLGAEASLRAYQPLLSEHGVTTSTMTGAAGRPPALAGVLALDTAHQEDAARWAFRSQVPGNAPEAVRACLDKAIATATLSTARVPTVQAIECDTAAEASRAAEWLSYPVVLRHPLPTPGSAARVESPADLAAAWRLFDAPDSRQPGRGVILSDEIPGPEVAVVYVSARGRHHGLAAIHRIHLGGTSLATLEDSCRAGDLCLQRTSDVAQQALNALDVTSGLSQVRLRLTMQGPKVLSVTPGLTGDHAAQLVHLATGVDVIRASVDIARGRTPNLGEQRRRCAAVRHMYPRTAGQLYSHGVDPALSQVAWLDRLHWPQPLGGLVEAPRGGIEPVPLASVQVVGPDLDTVQDRLYRAVHAVEIRIAPLPGARNAGSAA